MKKIAIALFLFSLVFTVLAQDIPTDTLFKGDYQNAEKLYNEGVKLFTNKNFAAATKKFDEAIALKPDFKRLILTREL